MNKQQLINNIANLADAPKGLVERVLEGLASTIQQELDRNGDVAIPGVGRFKQGYREGRLGRNPRTGEEVVISGKFYAKFTAAKALKDAIN